MNTVRAHVAHRKNRVLHDLPLYIQMPGLYVTSGNVFGDVAGLCQQRAEVLRRCKVVWVALRHRAEAAGKIIAGAQWLWLAAKAERGHLGNGGVDDIGAVIGQQIFSALTVELIETEAVSRTDDRLRIQLVRHSKAWREIELRRIDQRPIVERSAARLDE